jgi:hypothetical protein
MPTEDIEDICSRMSAVATATHQDFVCTRFAWQVVRWVRCSSNDGSFNNNAA